LIATTKIRRPAISTAVSAGESSSVRSPAAAGAKGLGMRCPVQRIALPVKCIFFEQCRFDWKRRSAVLWKAKGERSKTFWRCGPVLAEAPPLSSIPRPHDTGLGLPAFTLKVRTRTYVLP
jgi:hypothetical protein